MTDDQASKIAELELQIADLKEENRKLGIKVKELQNQLTQSRARNWSR